MSKWYVVSDMEEFTDKARSIVYSNFGNWDAEIVIENTDLPPKSIEELDKILTYTESHTIIRSLCKKQRSKISQNIRYVIDSAIFTKILETLNGRMISNLLQSLVNKGFVETAFDDKSNDFIFWVKDNEKDTQEKPEAD